jgi:2-keto-myo-inositol isomerase
VGTAYHNVSLPGPQWLGQKNWPAAKVRSAVLFETRFRTFAKSNRAFACGSDMVFVMLARRSVLQAALMLAAENASAAGRKMTLSMHQFTSAGAGYRKSLEGWAKAGIRDVEPSAGLLDDYLKTDTLAGAKRILTDNGLQIVSGAIGVTGLWEPNPNFSKNLDAFKKRCEQFAELGAPLVYSPCATAAKFTLDDYLRCIDNIRKTAEVARQCKVKVAAEFVRNSTFLASLPTALRLHRAAAHPNFGILFDCYHFWSGPSKLEDMDLIQGGEIIHAHLNDTQDLPRELLDLHSRVIPGDGVAPLVKMLGKLADRGYSGPISVELFLPKFQEADPFELAKEIKLKCEAVFKQAAV